MARKHYHVMVGTPGCLPDYNAAHTSRRAAEADAAWYARDCREAYNPDNDCKVIVTGSAKSGRYDIERRADRSTSGWELWQYIEIVDCYEDDCYDEDGELWQE